MSVIQCVSCSVKVNSEVAHCPQCGADPRTGEQPAGLDAGFDGVSVGFAHYLGGCPDLGEPRSGNLFISKEWIGFAPPATRIPESRVLATPTVKNVEVAGEEIAKNKVLPVLAFGILGLAAKGSSKQTYVVVHLRSGKTAYYQIGDTTPLQVRARIAGTLHSAGVPFDDEQPRGDDMAGGIGDQLALLARLHSDGALTDEEFAQAKRKALGEGASN